MSHRAHRERKEKRNPQTDSQPEPPLLADLRRRLAEFDSESASARFEALYQAVMTIDAEADSLFQEDVPLELDCESCQDLLDLYVTDEIKGYPVKSEYHLVWDHLQTCYHCMQSYIGLTNLLTEQSDEDTTALPTFETSPASKELSFLKPQAAKTPWITRLQSQLDGSPFTLAFQFNTAYLQTLFSSLPAVPVRAEASLPSPTSPLLLYQDVRIGQETLTVEIVYTRIPDKANTVALAATLFGLDPLPEGLWAYLTWAGESFATAVNEQGQVIFEEVSVTSLKEAIGTGAEELSITFAIREGASNVQANHE